MDARTRQVLQANDSATEIEFPAEFDWQNAMRRVKRFKPEAETILGMPLHIDEFVQDASHFTDLFVFEDGAESANGSVTLVYKIAIRFPSFGNLATVYTNSTRSDITKYPVQQLAAFLDRHGFVYVDRHALNEPYDGTLKPLHGQTWWSRFFDYM